MSLRWIQSAQALVFSSFVVSLIATLGSLFFSEVLLYPPCLLCWYQRICMYPLPILFAVSFMSEDSAVFKYTSPLVIIGLVIAIYHNLLYYHILPESVAPCTQGISCTTVQINWLGFITIPLLSLVAFLILITISIFAWRIKK